MAATRTYCSLLLLSALAASAGATATGHAANPIRKVVTMLQNMQSKVEEEGKKAEKLYDEAMCYCQTTATNVEQSIADGKAKVEALTAAKEGGSSKLVELQASLKAHQTSREEAKQAMATATALREKEASTYASYKADTEKNLAALEKAVAAIAAGTGGSASFVQTTAAAALKRFAMEKATMNDAARDEVLAFLSGTQDEEYAPASGEITGILKQMGDQMAADLKDSTAAEEAAIKSYDGLMAAKTAEVDTLTAQIEEEMMRVGEMGVGGATTEDDLEDTKAQIEKDIAFLAELKKSCATKTTEFEALKKTMAEEQVALSDTIKVLSDDDALELFKKTLPSAAASFMQIAVSAAAVKARALAVLRSAPHRAGHPALDLIALALNGKQTGFEKVIGMVDEMIVTLKAEQADDDAKVAYCNKEFDAAEDKKKGTELAIADSETAIDELKGSIAAIASEIEALEDGIKKLDKSVEEATAQRKGENADYKELMANDAMAKEVLLWAKNRLNKFYNPKLYVEPAKRELSAEDQIVVDMGGTLAPTSPPGGIGGTGIGAVLVQVHAHSQTHKHQKEDSSGVIGMIDLLIADLDKETQESDVMEADAQKDYEAMIAESKEKRATDTEALTNKGAAKAEAEEALGAETSTLGETKTDLMQTEAYIASLHGECDWIMKFYDMRKEARDSEIDALGKAKAVLSGADYSLVQTRARHSLLRR